MKRIFALLAGLLLLGVASASDDEKNVLEFRTMAGVQGPFIGPTNAIRGVPGAGAAWKVASAHGELNSDGNLELRVRGLVLVRTGTNPVATFRAVVSCQSIDGAGKPSIVNVSTGDFPATPGGDASIEARLSLPKPCIAPIVFVTLSAGRWIAVTGTDAPGPRNDDPDSDN